MVEFGKKKSAYLLSRVLFLCGLGGNISVSSMGVCLKCFVIVLVNSRYIDFEAVRMKTVIIAYILAKSSNRPLAFYYFFFTT